MNKDRIEIWIIDAYAINKANGFHDASYNDNHRLMMIVTEIGEAIEADRKGKHLDKKAFDIFAFIDNEFKNDEYWKKGGFSRMFCNTVKDTFEDELADVIIRCCDFLGTKETTFKKAFTKPVEFPDGFYNHFAEKGWDWVRILNNAEFEVEARVAGLLYEVLWFCEEQGIDIEKHVDWKLRYNLSRPRLHGKTY